MISAPELRGLHGGGGDGQMGADNYTRCGRLSMRMRRAGMRRRHFVCEYAEGGACEEDPWDDLSARVHVIACVYDLIAFELAFEQSSGRLALQGSVCLAMCVLWCIDSSVRRGES